MDIITLTIYVNDNEIAANVEEEHPADCDCRHCDPEPVDSEERYIHEDTDSLEDHGITLGSYTS